MARLLLLLVLAGCLMQCAAPRHGCIDILDQKSKVKAYRHLRKSDHRIAKTKPAPSESIHWGEHPLVAALGHDASLQEQGAALRRVPGLVQELKNDLPANTPPHEEVHLAVLPTPVPPEVSQRMRQLQDTISMFDINYKQAKNLGIASFALALGSILAVAVPALILPMIVASIVTGVISLKKYRKSLNKEGKIFPILGLIISSIWFVLILIALVVVILLFATWGTV